MHYRVTSTKMQNFLGEHGCFPAYEMEGGAACYVPNDKFFELLERYEIQKAMKNKL